MSPFLINKTPSDVTTNADDLRTEINHRTPTYLFVSANATTESVHIFCFRLVLYLLHSFFAKNLFAYIEKTTRPLWGNCSFIPSFSRLGPVISVNWFWITEVTLQVSEVAGAEESRPAFALHICLHVCAITWVHIPYNSAASGQKCGTSLAFFKIVYSSIHFFTGLVCKLKVFMGPKIRQNNSVKELPGKEQDILDLKQRKKRKRKKKNGIGAQTPRWTGSQENRTST